MVINVQIEGLKELQKKLNNSANNLKQMQKFWHSVGEYMKKRTIKECFDKEQSPDGQKWKPLSKARHKQRIKKGANYKILTDTGELRRSVQYKASDNDVVIGSNLKYAPIHQFGSSKKNIPARPFLGVTQNDKNFILNMMKTYVQRSL